jgi:hypothetical protein
LAWVNPGAPEDLVRHPISHPWKHRLHEQGGLHGEPRTPTHKLVNAIDGKLLRRDGRRQVHPPTWRFIRAVEKHSPKHSRISQNERLRSLEECKMIVPCRNKAWPFNAQSSAHSEVNAKPAPPRKPKEHAFAVGLGGKQARPF